MSAGFADGGAVAEDVEVVEFRSLAELQGAAAAQSQAPDPSDQTVTSQLPPSRMPQ